MAAQDLILDTFWCNRTQVENAEIAFQSYLAAQQFGGAPATGKASSLASEIEKARNQIKQSLNLDKSVEPSSGAGGSGSSDVLNRIAVLEKENKELRQVTSDLQAAVKKLEQKIQKLDAGQQTLAQKPAVSQPAAKTEPKEETDDDDDDDDDIDLFGDDSDDEEAERLKQERIKQYQEKKGKKPAVIAKSNIILDVKPWDDETDMKEMERLVRSIEMDGLLWGTAKLVEIGYGIKKLVISCVVEDDKVSTDDLEDKITGFEDYVQSMDIAAFNKI